MNNNKIKKLLVLITNISIIIFWYVSLFYYIWNIGEHNIAKLINPSVGNIGIKISEFSFYLFGYASLLLPILFFLPGFYYFKNDFHSKLYYKILLILGFILNISMTLDFFHDSQSLLLGGIVGKYLITQFILPQIGKIGTIILISMVYILFIPFSLSIFNNSTFSTKLNNIFLGVVNKFKPLLKIFKQEKRKKNISPEKDISTKNNAKANISTNTFDDIPLTDTNENVEKKYSHQNQKSTNQLSDEVRIGSIYEEKKLVNNLNVDNKNYIQPPLSLLSEPVKIDKTRIEDEQKKNAQKLIDGLAKFKVYGELYDIQPGPIVTRYEIKPADGVKVSKFTTLANDLARVMKAENVRIIAPIPNKEAVGIEVPNSHRATIYLKEILQSPKFNNKLNENSIILALGKNIAGVPTVTDLCKMPHLLIAGATGAGKSVCLNSIITSILYQSSPDKVKFLMIDPKRVELSSYEGIPHLLHPVIIHHEDAIAALNYAAEEMEDRYSKLSKFKVRNIKEYNALIKSKKHIHFLSEYDNIEDYQPMPFWIIVIDELANIMMAAGKDFDRAIARLAQMSRAVGIHLIIATQRPSVDIITGVIKANFPSRIAFRTSSKVDSRTIIDTVGAEKLLGNGDMLFLTPGNTSIKRIHGAYISSNEVSQIVEFIKEHNQHLQTKHVSLLETKNTINILSSKMDRDELFDEAAELVIYNQQASVSMLQRRLGIGYARAGKLIDNLEKEGIVGKHKGSKAREVLITPEEYEELKKNNNKK